MVSDLLSVNHSKSEPVFIMTTVALDDDDIPTHSSSPRILSTCRSLLAHMPGALSSWAPLVFRGA